jgi:nitrilase
MEKSSLVRVAVVQAAPVLFNKDATIDKALEWIERAYTERATLVLFPEAFIPAYPRGLSFGCKVGSRSVEGREVWQVYFDNAIEIPGPEVNILSEASRKFSVYLSIGVVEKEYGTLYCTQLMFGPTGKLLGKHRKIKPTASERIIWGEGDGTTLTTYDTEIGKIGGLICWENYMPLARVAMYQKGVQIYLAPTADHRQSWQTTLQHIAVEGGCYVLGCNQFVTMDMYPGHIRSLENMEGNNEIICRGGSVIVDPFGEVLRGPLWNKEGLLMADLDPGCITKRKMDLDVAGHYSRPDIFEFRVIGQPETVSKEEG